MWKCRSIEHVLTMVRPNKTFVQGRLTNCKMKYGKWKCMGCAHIVRSYGSCTPGLMYCTDCVPMLQETRKGRHNLVPPPPQSPSLVCTFRDIDRILRKRPVMNYLAYSITNNYIYCLSKLVGWFFRYGKGGIPQICRIPWV